MQVNAKVYEAYKVSNLLTYKQVFFLFFMSEAVVAVLVRAFGKTVAGHKWKMYLASLLANERNS